MSLPSVGGLLVDASEAPETSSRLPGRFDGEHVLAPLLAPEGQTVADQLQVARTLARVTGASLSVVDPRSGTGRDTGDALPQVDRDLTSPVQTGGLGYTRDLVRDVLGTVRASDVDTLVLPSGSVVGRVRAGIVDRIAAQTDSDVLVVNGQSGYGSVASILLPIAGGPHSGLAADFARVVAADSGAWIDVVHVVDEEATDRERDEADKLVEGTYDRIGRTDTTTTWVLEADDTAEAIIEQSRCYDLTVLGAPTKSRLREFLHGSTTRTVRQNARSVVLSARNNSSDATDSS